MQSDAERIATGLTEAQRRAVLGAKEAAWGMDNYLISTKTASSTWRKLVDYWIIDPTNHSRSLTKTGLEVRAILERNRNGNGN